MSHAARTLLVVSIAVFMATLDLFVVNIAFPDVQAEWPGESVAAISWVLNAYAIVYAAFLVPAGRLADRVGRRAGFVAGLVVFTAASALCAAAGSVQLLVAARILQALGAAMLTPTALALLLEAFPPARRAAAIGVWAAIGGVAAAAGPPLGGLLVEASWRWVFLVNVPVGTVAVLAALRVLHESRDETRRAWPDLLGTVLLTGAVGLMALGVVQAPEWGWSDGRVVAALAGFAIGTLAFLLRSARHPSPVVELSMLRVRSYAMANAAMLLFFAAFSAMLLAGVLFLTQVWGDSVLRAGLSLAPGPLMAAAFAVPAGRLGERVGQHLVAGAGCSLFALGCAWWAIRLGPSHDYAGAFLPGIVLTGIGVGLTLSTLSAAAAASLPPHRFATGSGVFTMSRQLGAVVGVAAFVAVLGRPSPAQVVDAFADGWTTMTILSAVAAGAALAVGRVATAPAPAVAAPGPFDEVTGTTIAGVQR